MQYDIAIVGSGLVGSSLAIALLNHGFKVAIIDKGALASRSSLDFDSRALALSYTSCRCLKTLGISVEKLEHAVPMREVQITEQGHFGLTTITAETMNLPYLGMVIPADTLNAVLNQGLEHRSDLTLYPNSDIKNVKQGSDSSEIPATWTLELSSGKAIQTSLLVGADGSNSFIRQYLGVGVSTSEFPQSAIVVNIQLNQPHQGIAFERFMPEGSLALLPLKEDRVKCVWVVKNEALKNEMTISEKEFLSKLQKNFGYQLGIFKSMGKRTMYPLKQMSADNLYGSGWVLIGNAANTLHPIAAQGFNLGLRDVATLAELVVESKNRYNYSTQRNEEKFIKNNEASAASNLTPPVETLQNRLLAKLGSVELLSRYASKRYPDHSRVRMFTESLIEDGLPRRFGILACEFIPSVHRWVSRLGLGLQEELPKLMRGIPL
jgi:2-octaprenyl-6-methoxyphenol hydroxylase